MHFRSHVAWVCVAAALLAGCNGGIASSSFQGAGRAPAGFEIGVSALSNARLAAMTMPHYIDEPVRRDYGKSWIARDAKLQKKLLYVSDWATDNVFIYRYPRALLLGKLTGFARPYGQCADAAGDIWIADFEASSIVEYPHGGTTPIARLATNGSAIGCAVSPNGDLAVSNFTSSQGGGDIQVFRDASGSPTDYSNASCYYLWAPGYDKKGNLYVEGKNSAPAVCELPAGGTSFVAVSINQSIGSPGSVMWDGKYITLTDQRYDATESTAIYQTTESESGNLTVVGTTDLTDTCNQTNADILQPFIVGNLNTPALRQQGTLVAGGNITCDARFGYWAYPFPSGNPIVVITDAPARPFGQGYSTLDKIK